MVQTRRSVRIENNNSKKWKIFQQSVIDLENFYKNKDLGSWCSDITCTLFIGDLCELIINNFKLIYLYLTIGEDYDYFLNSLSIDLNKYLVLIANNITNKKIIIKKITQRIKKLISMCDKQINSI